MGDESIDFGQSLSCPGCGYDLRGIESERCPECGIVSSRCWLTAHYDLELVVKAGSTGKDRAIGVTSGFAN